MAAPTYEQYLALKAEVVKARSEAAAQIEAAEQRAQKAEEGAREYKRQVDADHDAAFERLEAELSKKPAARRIAKLEAEAAKARQELQDAEQRWQERLKAERRDHLAKRQQFTARERRLRHELKQAQAAPAELQAELDQTRARLQEWEARSRAAAEPQVLVRWLQDAPAGGATIGGRRYRGFGPKVREGPLVVDGTRVPSQRTTVIEQPGQVMSVPVSAARVLAEAGFVQLTGPATKQDALDRDLRNLQAEQPRNAKELRQRAAVLQKLADRVEQASKQAADA